MNANNSVIKVLAEALEKGVSIFLDGESLKLKVAKNKKIDPDFLKFIKGYKEEITQFLHSQRDTMQENEFQMEPLEKIDREAYTKLPLSFSQERLWFIDNLDGSIAYNMPSVLKFKGEINVEFLEYAFQAIINRHEVLRTVFEAEEGQPYQVILPENNWKLTVLEDASLGNDEVLKQYIDAEVKKPFNLAKDFMLRATLIKNAKEESILIMVMHHIASDGWSIPILVDELVELYVSKLEGRASNLQELPIQYVDYAVWQKEYLQGKVLDDKLSYWEKTLQGTEPINLPNDFVRPATQSTNGNTTGILIDKKLSNQIAALAKTTGVTMSMLMLSVLKILLSRYSGQKDICVGMPVANRGASEIESLLGFFVNTLALRNNLEENLPFTDFINVVRKNMLNAFSHQDVPFEKIVSRVERTRDMSRSPLFQVAYTFNNTDEVSEVLLGTVAMEEIPFKDETTPYDLSWDMMETPNGIEVEIQYCTDLFKASTIERMLKHFNQLLSSVVVDPTAAIEDLSMLLPEEEAMILGQQATPNGEWFNQPAKDLGNVEPINVRFEKVVAANENEVAVIHGEMRWTYGQINDLANQIGHQLQAAGVQPGEFVGVYMDRNPVLVSALLGIVKSGAAYVPLDTQNPVERIEKMIDNSNMAAIISTNKLVAGLDKIATSRVFLMDRDDVALEDKLEIQNIALYNRSAIDAAETANIPNQNKLDSWAYMLFTSGSTGEPKGAITRHDGALNHILAEYDLMELEDGFRFLQSAGIGSDISLWQMLAPVLKGGAVVIVDKFDILNYDAIINLLEKEAISVVEFVPSYIWGLVERLKTHTNPPALNDLKWIMMVGEQVPVKLVNDFRDLYPQIRILNGYGPCEASDDITQYEVIGKLDPKQIRVPIGHSLTNMNMFVVDPKGKLCPVGIAGELCVSGIGVGAGYYGMPDKTAASFIPNPFPGTLGDVLYKTGDLGRWLEDGTLEFLGRIDRQVKIRGHRVELGEIETYIRDQSNIKDTHVMVCKGDEDGSPDALVAFVVADEEDGADYRVIGKELLNKVEANIEKHIAENPHLANEVIELEKGIKAFALNKSESLFAYNEIFEEQAYLINGITLQPGDVVFDVGANVGMFSMYVSLHFPGSEIYSFEPLPPTFEIMNSNCIIYGAEAKIKAYRAGLSDKNQKVTFTHYPDNSMLSGRYGDLEEDKSYVRNVLERQLRDEEDQGSDIDVLVEKTMNYEEYECQLLSLSEIIEENDIKQIDLLKVDVERSELDVLRGIKPEHWSLIKQIVIEVHDDGNSLDKVKEFLDTYGFNYLVEQEDLLVGTHLYNIYALRPDVSGENVVENVTPELIGLDSITKELFANCQDGLPAYMQPTEYCIIDKIPLNLSDKVDQKALITKLEEERLKATGQTKNTSAKPCSTEQEENILAIWEKLLNRTGIGVDEDFFEAGGHSLLAMRVKASLQKDLGVNIDIRDLFFYTTIESLAAYVDQLENGITRLALTPQERPEKLPLSFAQERLWFIDQLEGSVHYHMPIALNLKGSLEVNILHGALNEIINRHEILRTVYKEEEGIAYQSILPENTWILDEVDGTALTTEAALHEFIEAETAIPFNLSTDHMIRAKLLKLGEEDYVLVMVVHHIAFDGWSEAVMVEEFIELYKTKKEGRASNLPAIEIQYADYAIWQGKYLTDEVLEDKLAYWAEKLNGVEPLKLPTDFARKAIHNNEGNYLHFNIDEQTTERLDALATEEGVTLFMLLTAAFNILLHKHTGQDDITIGTPTANRTEAEIESLIGFFVNVLVLRTDLSDNPTFKDLLYQTKRNTLDAYTHQDVPFEKIVDRVVKNRDMTRSPLFQVMFVYQNTPEVPELNLGGVTLEPVDFKEDTSKFDITFNVEKNTTGLDFTIQYRSDLFLTDTITRMMEHFEILLASVLENTSQRVTALSVLSATEQSQLLLDFNNTDQAYPKDKTLVELFEERALEMPQNIAVDFQGKQLTYKALNELSNQLGSWLRNNYAVAADDLVGIQLDRSEWMIVAILGALKAGAAYVPIDPEYPAERISYIIEDSQCNVVVDAELLETFKQEQANLPTANLPLIGDESNLAYVIYTSGSTGQPKGCMLEHRGAVNYMTAQINEFGIDEKEHILQLASISFDTSVEQIFIALLSGATLHLITKDTIVDAEKLTAFINDNSITHVHSVPSLLQTIEPKPYTALKRVVSGGERCPVELAEAWAEHLDFYNKYGPTEATITSIEQKCNGKIAGKDSLSIGRPIANTQIYILGDQRELLPIGAVGEICIGGDGLARGYHNRPDLTAAKFIANPFAKGKRLYKTGDLGRWLANGEIEFFGRKDDQVKLRGFRIELGEIEKALQQSAQIEQCVVLVKENNGLQQLVAYIGSAETVDQAELKEFLAGKLPAFMIPSLFIQLDEFPLLPNGKVNRKALPDPDRTSFGSGEFIAPETKTEQLLASIWQNLLNVEAVGRYDNFFDLGGHSLLISRVIAAIRKDLGVALQMRDAFTYPSIATLAAYIEGLEEDLTWTDLKAQVRPANIPLSFSQESLWFIDQLEGSLHYHMPSILKFEGDLDIQKLESAFKDVVNRHEVLRTVIKEVDGKGFQKVLDKNLWTLEVTELKNLKEDQDVFVDKVINKAFDLSKDHMLRAHLLQTGEKEYELIFVMHHIAADGWSMSILVEELLELYAAKVEDRTASLTDLSIQYSDYSIWQRENLSEDILDEKLDYWKKQLAGTEPLNLPTDYARPNIQSTNGESYSFDIDPTLSAELETLAQKEGVTMFMLLLSALQVFLSKYSGQNDICIGTSVSNRMHTDIEPLIGYFLNTLALRSDLSDNPEFTSLLSQVKESTLSAYNNQDIPFDKIVDRLEEKRDRSRSPLFQVMLVLQNMPSVPELVLENLVFSPEILEDRTTIVDLTFYITETDNGLKVNLVYCKDLFARTRIERMMEHFQVLLSAIAGNANQTIGDLSMLTTKEETQLISLIDNTAVEYPRDQTVVDLFKAQVDKTPNAPALVFAGKTLTYAELDAQTDKLAAYLKTTYNLEADDLVGIMMDRSAWMVVSILGILKSGAAYVPIDTAYPIERKSFIIQDTNIKALIIQSEHLFDVIEFNVNVFSIDIQMDDIDDNLDLAALDINVNTNDLAYVIYTSGSTGKPKGVMIEHSSLMNYLNYCETIYGAELDAFNFPLFTSLSFDLTQTSVFLPFISGGALFVESGNELDEILNRIVNNETINSIKLTPSHSFLLEEVNQKSNIRMAIVGGEKLEKGHVLKLQSLNKEVRIFNEYGPTEATIGCIVYEVKDANAKILIGEPIFNTQIYITDPVQSLVPMGVKGEICIGGDGLARGYLNRPELNAEKFIDNPFSDQEGAKMYRTGDLACWNADGNIEYFGRVDDQVKIRGFRIELGEVESAVLKSGLVTQCTVLAKDGKNNRKRLVAYVVEEAGYTKEKLQTYLKAQLPEYMVPGLVMELDELPLTVNGKVNKNALPDPDSSSLNNDQYLAPETEVEAKLAEIWKGLLKVERVGINDNFFELGGDSIITIQVVSRAKRVGLQLKPSDLFEHQTVASLAKVIEAGQVAIQAEQGTLEGEAELLPIQKWFFENGSAKDHFNQSEILELNKTVSAEHLSLTLQAIVDHHDALRFEYETINGEWTQNYGTRAGALELLDLSDLATNELAGAIEKAGQAYQESLNIETGELIKAVLIQTPDSETNNRLFIAIHHLAVDGVSWRILIDHIEECLNQLTAGKTIDLGEKTTSYREWVQALQEYTTTSKVENQLPYWKSIAETEVELPTDNPVESTLKKDMKSLAVSLDTSLTQALLKEVNQSYNTEINDLLLSALARTISNWSDNQQVIIGMEGHGREDLFTEIDITNTVGWFTNLYPVLLDLAPNLDERGLIKTVKEQLRVVPNKGMGYGLLRYLHPSDEVRTQLSTTKWDIVFNYLGQYDNALNENGRFQAAKEDAGNPIAGNYSYDAKLDVNGMISNGALTLSWSYSEQQYDAATIEQLANNYIANLTNIIEHCVAKEETERTPSDYGLAPEVSYVELDQFLNRIENGIPMREQLSAIYPLSPVQEGMLFHGLYDRNSKAYTVQYRFELPEGLDIDAFGSSFEYVINNHTILRSGFVYDEFSIPVQCVYKKADLPLEILDYSDLEGTELAEKLEALMRADHERGFDFSEAPLMRVTLIKINEVAYKMVWTSHHILMDGWSVPVVMEELLSAYANILNNEELAERELDNYEDYINYIKGKDKDEEAGFWKEYMNGFESPTLIPFVGNTLERNKGNGELHALELLLDEKRTEEIKQYAQENHLTVNTLIQGIWALLLSKYTGNKDTAFGVTVSGRPGDLENAEDKVGLFINTLPLRGTINEEQSVASWLSDIQLGHTSAREYQYTSQTEIQNWIGVKGDFFDSIVVFENYPMEDVLKSKSVLKVSSEDGKDENNYLLSIVVGLSDILEIKFAYYDSLLSEETIGLIRGHFEQAIDQIISNAKANVADISIVTPNEMALLDSFNNTAVDYPTDKTIVNLFEEQVLNTPNNIAISYEGETLTFEAFNAKANQLANYLRGKGVREESLVAICTDRSLDMMIGLMGILKAGGAYVPIDPGYPKERINYIIENANAKFAISHKGFASLFDEGEDVENIRLDEDWAAIAQESAENFEIDLQPENLMYVIYTSGSTGKPKGVMNQHSGVVNRLLWTQAHYQLDHQSDVILQKTTFCFDVSVWELFWPLISGVKLVMAKPEGHKDSEYLKEVIEQEGVTTMHFVPSMLEVFLLDIDSDVCPGLRRVLCSGEALKPSHVLQFKEKLGHVALHNLYGPTEAAIDVTEWTIPQGEESVEKVPIGKPVANTQLYILDKAGKICGVGVPGELFLAGIQVARGYYNRPDLTTERFIDNPFDKTDGGKMYKTGDLAKWMLDGNIEYLGRIDNQVKIRGNRIELGEIENVIDLSPLATQSIVVAKEDPSGNKRLVAYIVPVGDFDKAAMQTYIKSHLPEYMAPSLMVTIDEMPLTPNGKVDRKALPDPDVSQLITTQYVAPRNEQEEEIAAIWMRLLKVEQIGINDNFFDLGGHSLLATRVVSAIRKQLKVEIEIKDIFTHSTVALLSEALLGNASENVLPEIVPTERPLAIPLSFSQERLWFIDQFQGTTQYHLPAVLRFKGSLDVELLNKAFKTIVNRHEVLRTVFKSDDGVGRQVILEENLWSMTFNAEEVITDRTLLDEKIELAINEPFDLSNDHMLRAELVQVATDEYVLIFVMHHIASDGWSIPLFIDELTELYLAGKEGREPELKHLPIQYADYAIWQRAYLEGTVLDNKLDYWTEQLKDIEPLNLPTDFSRPAVQSTKGSGLTFTINAEVTQQLNELAKAQNVTLYMLLLSALKVMLHKYSGQDDIIVGSPIANRVQEEVESIIGFFVNTLALRSDLSENPRFVDLLADVKSTTLEAYGNQDVPFEKIVDRVVSKRDQSRTPLFQVMLALQNNQKAGEVNLNDVVLSAEPFTKDSAQFDLNFDIIESEEGLEVEIIYCTDLFAAATIERMQNHFQMLLNGVIAQPEVKIGELSMLTVDEQQQLLVDFNDTAVNYPTDKTIVDLFLAQVIKTPNADAITFEGRSMTYLELHEKSNQLAHYLRAKGVKEESLVAICVDRSFEMIVGLMGILKAGGAYVPIDPDYPQERVSYIIENANANFAISHKGYDSQFGAEVENILIDKDWDTIAKGSVENLTIDLKPENLMYVIYTSGSTGKPKGVMNQHSGLVNRLIWTHTEYGLMAGKDAILQKTTFCFDVSVWELFWPLISGVRMVIARPGGHKDSDYLREVIEAESVTTMHFVPSMLEVFLLDVEPGVCSSLKRVLCSGEALKPSQVTAFKEKLGHVELHNLYGPTEAAIDVTYWAIPEGNVEKVLIGQPVANTQLYILNKAGNLTALGVPGELFLAGIQVARGYYNRPDLTEERFIDNPFSDEPGAKMYKTGDLARWLPDGNIEYLGRIDNQVKIRGNRIELGEIESVLQTSDQVNQCVVLAKEDIHGNKRLVAYVVVEEAFDKGAIQSFLKGHLPEYMVPGIIMELPTIPLTPNGKINRKALPEPTAEVLVTTEYLAPRNEIEAQLAEIWKNLLNAQRVGVNDNFFDLGGDSIITIQAVSRAKSAGFNLKPRNLFDYQTVAQLAEFIENGGNNEIIAEQGRLEGAANLLPIQQSFLDNEYDGMNYYNQSVLLEIDKLIDDEVIDKIVKAIVDHHDALRFSYTKEDGQWIQKYSDIEGGLEAVDLSETTAEDFNDSIQYVCEKVHQNLDLEKGKMMRAVLIKTPEKVAMNRFFIAIHHLAVDGVSWRILMDDIQNALVAARKGEAIQLGSKTSSFRQWVDALTKYAASNKVTSEQEYWKSIVTQYQPLPTDKAVTEQPLMKDQNSYSVSLSESLTNSLLKEVNQRYNTEINDILLSALVETINNWTGEQQLVVGLEGHGREDLFSDLDVSKTVGWFTSLYPILLKSEKELSARDLIRSVKEEMRGIPSKGMGYGLLRNLHPNQEVRDALADGKWDVIFNYLGQFDGLLEEGNAFKAAEEDTGRDESGNRPFTTKLEFNGSVYDGQLSLSIRYATALYEAETIAQIAEQYIANLTKLIEHCLEADGTEMTPSDFGLNGKVSYKEMDDFLGGSTANDDYDNLDDDSILKF